MSEDLVIQEEFPVAYGPEKLAERGRHRFGFTEAGNVRVDAQAQGTLLPITSIKGAHLVDEQPPYTDAVIVQFGENDTVWMNTAHENRVAIEVDPPQEWGPRGVGSNWPLRRLIVNLEDPQGFIDAVADRQQSSDPNASR